jgi:hypothetical protein
MELHPCFRGNLGSRDGLPGIPRLGNASPLVRHWHPSNHPRSPSTRGQTSSTAPAACQAIRLSSDCLWFVRLRGQYRCARRMARGSLTSATGRIRRWTLGRRYREARTHWTGRSAERSRLPRRPAGSPDFPHRTRIASDRLQPDPNSPRHSIGRGRGAAPWPARAWPSPQLCASTNSSGCVRSRPALDGGSFSPVRMYQC